MDKFFNYSTFSGAKLAQQQGTNSPRFVWSPGFPEAVQRSVEEQVGRMANFLGHLADVVLYILAPNLFPTKYETAAHSCCEALAGNPMAGNINPFGGSIWECVAAKNVFRMCILISEVIARWTLTAE